MRAKSSKQRCPALCLKTSYAKLVKVLVLELFYGTRTRVHFSISVLVLHHHHIYLFTK